MAESGMDVGRLDPDEIDVDVLWKQLMSAREAGDVQRVRAIENRMRELQGERRFAHLDDEELEERIRTLSGEREPRDLIAHSPGGGGGGDNAGGEDLLKLNNQIRANQHAGIEQTLNALLDELARRQA